MPPKKAAVALSKSDVAKKKKVVEDKTFGLKNKNKSKKVQQFIQQQQQGLQNSIKQQSKDGERAKLERQRKKEAEAAKKDELAILFNAVQQSVPVGVDSKSVLCQFFKQGTCRKGDKCKYSHDLTIGRKTAKIDLYADPRHYKEGETMENWDQEKLEAVVEIHGNQQANSTEIICKYFLEAVENRKYGFFWVCPNGGKECKYKHALPPGFKLKSEEKKVADEDDEVTMEEHIEQERQLLVGRSDLQRVTAESFAKWRKDKEARKKEAIDKLAKEAQIKNTRGIMSGRDLFTFDPTMFIDDTDAMDAAEVEIQSDQEDDEPEPNRAVAQLDGGMMGEGEVGVTEHADVDDNEDEDGDEEAGDDGEQSGNDDDDDDDEQNGDDDVEDEEEGVAAKPKEKADKQQTKSNTATDAVDESVFLEDADVPDDD